jgi:dienelactone hydrolase
MTAYTPVIALCLFTLAGESSAQNREQPAGPPPSQPSDWASPTGTVKVVFEEDTTISDHTLYRPADISQYGGANKLPVVAFTGPGCEPIGTAFRPFFVELASHGFLVVASGAPEEAGRYSRTAPKTKASDLTAVLDWAQKQDGAADSRFKGKLDTEHMAVMGQSCGGLQALSLAGDARIKTLVLWNSGVLNAPRVTASAGAQTNAIAAAMSIGNDKTALNAVKVPIAYFVGKTDMASPNAQDDFKRLESVPVFVGILDIPGDAHGGTFRQKNGGEFAIAGVNWLKWQLKGDQAAAAWFKGANCRLCNASGWQVLKKRID